jgi:thiamine pyrophosphate-dependent acetolactate synthase large subunit-like protein
VATFPPPSQLLVENDHWRYLPSFRPSPHNVEVDPASAGVEEAAAVLMTARRPIIVAGRGAVRADARKEILRLAERVGALVATSVQAQGYFEGHPRNIGIFGSLSTERGADLITQADLVLAVGIALNPHQTAAMSPESRARVIQIDCERRRLGEYVLPDVALVADARAGVAAITRCLEDVGHANDSFWGGRLSAEDIQTAAQKPSPATVPKGAGRLPVSAMLREINSHLPSDRIVVSDGGAFVFFALDHITVPDPADWIWTLDFGSIGVGLPIAVGAAVARPDRPVILVCGDGGLAMSIQEFDTIAREEIPLTVLVVNDAAYGAEVRFLEMHGNPIDAALFKDLAFADIATGFGIRSTTVTTIEDLKSLGALLAERSALVIDAKVNADEPHRRFQ